MTTNSSYVVTYYKFFDLFIATPIDRTNKVELISRDNGKTWQEAKKI